MTTPLPADVRVTISAGGVTTDGAFKLPAVDDKDKFVSEFLGQLKWKVSCLYHDIRHVTAGDLYAQIVTTAYKRKTVDVEGRYLNRFGAPPEGRTALEFWLEQDLRYIAPNAFPDLYSALLRGTPLPPEFADFDPPQGA